MFHACVTRFDMIKNLKNFINFFRLNKAWVCMCVCCSAVQCTPTPPHGRSISDQVHILQSHTIACTGRAGLISSLISLQWQPPIVSEYFVFVQSGEFPASCMCQGVCVCARSWLPLLPVPACMLPAFSLDASSSSSRSSISLPPTSI
jgi:hypothetical protein